MSVSTKKTNRRSAAVQNQINRPMRRKRNRKKLTKVKEISPNASKSQEQEQTVHSSQELILENHIEDAECCSKKDFKKFLTNEGCIKQEELELLLKMTPCDVLSYLTSKNSGFNEILYLKSIPQIVVLIRILAIAFKSADYMEQRNILVFMLLKSKIFSTHFKMLIKLCPSHMLPSLLEQIGLLFITNNVITALSFGSRSERRAVVRFCNLLKEKTRDNGFSDDISLRINESYDMAKGICKNMKVANKNNLSKKKRKGRRQLPKPKNISYRAMNIIPTGEELLSTEDVYLRTVLERGKYHDIYHYLEVHFRLMREDLVGPLRKAVQEYKRLHRTEKLPRYGDAKFYRNVKITKEKSRFYKLEFDISKGSNWDRTEQFKGGSLLCISSDDFDTTYFGVVMIFEDEALSPHETLIYISDKVMNKHILDDIQYGSHFTVFESPAFYEAYIHVLRVLHCLQPGKLPLEDHIIKAKKEIPSPSYLQPDMTYSIPVDDLNSENIKEDVPIFEIDKWPHPSVLGLDISQMKALHHALSTSLALIHGPPGTGKTFIGLKIVQTLLYNKHKLNKINQKPILVVCFTNHALDQFLEGVLKFNQNLVRVGGQSVSEKLVDFNLATLRDNYFNDSTFDNEVIEIKKQIDEYQQILNKFKNYIFHECMFDFPEPDSVLIRNLKKISDDFESKSSLFAWLNLTFDKSVTDSNLLTFLDSKTQNVTYKVFNIVEGIKIADLINVKTYFKHTKKFKKTECYLGLKTACSMKHSDAQKEMKKTDIMGDDEVKEINDLWSLTLKDRWRLYRRWLTLLSAIVNGKIHGLESNIIKKIESIQKSSSELNSIILKKADIIGMTTTGAARNYKLLKKIGCQIVIVEEAAEVFESHVIASLSPKTKHLILIGDHQQLRPLPATYKLAKDYKIHVSLFERLINNELPHVTLEQQHRMRPEISSIARNHFYPSLRDHPVVTNFPSVVGMNTNVFFMTHSMPEAAFEQDSRTFKNCFEAEFVLSLSQYLLYQGYSANQICILATYSGQVTVIKDIIHKNSQFSKDIRVSTVDNFQGEESDIVLLSLVRSNSSSVIGFLKESNRITVALTRAKQGLYVIGNFELLAENSDYWNRIVIELKHKQWLGHSLPIVCTLHPENIRYLSTIKDFTKMTSKGFCKKTCGFMLQCGHTCIKLCHLGNHRCSEGKKKNVLLPCGHKATKPCDNNLDNYLCQELVLWMFPLCGHTVATECHINRGNIMCISCTQ